MQKPPVIFIMGPTAAGKTDLAVRLCQQLPCDIISVDSAMVYRGMDIGTSKPDAETLAIAPHRLIDICDPLDAYSAAQFRIDALREIVNSHNNHRIPLLVGGTFLYFRALEKGLSPLPAADPTVRAQLEAEALKIGWLKMHGKLKEIDPVSAARIHPNDPQRIQRALEVFKITGKSMTTIINSENQREFPYTIMKFAIYPEYRSVLHERIEHRFNQMLNAGFVNEVECLFKRGDLNKDLPSMRAVGYRQVWDFLNGESTFSEMKYKGIVATRQFAKRQLTWLRGETNITWLDSMVPDIYNQVLKTIVNAPIS